MHFFYLSFLWYSMMKLRAIPSCTGVGEIEDRFRFITGDEICNQALDPFRNNGVIWICGDVVMW
jgi:hypothetical protein